MADKKTKLLKLAAQSSKLDALASKMNAQDTKLTEGATSALPGSGGVMPGTPTIGGVPLNFTPTSSPMPLSLTTAGFPSSFPTSSFDVGGAIGGVISAGGCERLPQPLRAICEGAGVILNQPGEKPSKTGMQQATCPPGTVRVGNTCVSPGDVFPGGAPFLQEAGGQAVVGAFGLPALSPTIVGAVANARGEMTPIRRCMSGMVLGRDNLCYPKAVLPRRSQWRKHKAARRPPMTGADAAALRRIGTLQRRVKDLAKDARMTCKLR